MPVRLAILSDTHDHLWVLRDALPQIAAADVVLHCGDVCSPPLLQALAEGARGKPVHVVWGNSDTAARQMEQAAQALANLTCHGRLAELTLDEVRVAFHHYPETARALAGSGRYDLVCYGHDHRAHQEQVGACLLLNPGELAGLRSRPSFAFFDTQTRRAEFVALP